MKLRRKKPEARAPINILKARCDYGIIRSEREMLELPVKATSPGPFSVWSLDCVMVPGTTGIKKDFLPGHLFMKRSMVLWLTYRIRVTPQ